MTQLYPKAPKEGDPGPPNLDCMNIDELTDFFRETVKPNNKVIKFARKYFPSRRSSYVSVVRLLGTYASSKKTAMKMRADGRIKVAEMYEEVCDRVYRQLPDWGKF